MPEEGIVTKMTHSDILSLEEIFEMVEIGTELGITKVRITGGEPLVRKGAVKLIQNIGSLEKIKDLSITTNGILLKDCLDELADGGLKRLNISLDTLDREKYKRITRVDKLDDVQESIDRAIDLGLGVKINTVLIGGFNTEEIPDLIELTKDRPIQVRFIELMEMGETIGWDKESFVDNKIVLNYKKELEYIGTQGVAETYRVPGYRGTVGLISPVSCSFCDDCNRIRLTADGHLKSCLHGREESSVKELSREEKRQALKEAIYNKPKSHKLDSGHSESNRNMNTIGG